MRFGVKLMDETGTYKTFRFNVFHIQRLMPIDENDIDKGTHLVDIQGNVLISNEPIDEIELAMQKVEAEAVATMVQNMGIWLGKMTTKTKVKRSAAAAKKRTTNSKKK